MSAETFRIGFLPLVDALYLAFDLIEQAQQGGDLNRVKGPAQRP